MADDDDGVPPQTKFAAASVESSMSWIPLDLRKSFTEEKVRGDIVCCDRCQMAEGGVLTEECRVRRTDGWMENRVPLFHDLHDWTILRHFEGS
jgi:hypothetical protein